MSYEHAISIGVPAQIAARMDDPIFIEGGGGCMGNDAQHWRASGCDFNGKCYMGIGDTPDKATLACAELLAKRNHFLSLPHLERLRWMVRDGRKLETGEAQEAVTYIIHLLIEKFK